MLFVGLGNPGREYAMTRHNIGYLVIQALAKQMGLILREDRRFNAEVARGVCEKKTVHLLLPLTYMNLSGKALRGYLDYLKFPLSNAIVVSDDIALPFGQLRLRGMGSSGGHNGLKSIETHLGTSQYKRLRMGIGHPGERVLANYVLEGFNQSELHELPIFIDQAVDVLKLLMKESFSRVMNQVNTIPLQSTKKMEAESRSIDLTKPPEKGRGEEHESKKEN